MVNRIKKEIAGVKYMIKETETYLEYTIDRELVLGVNKENGTVLVTVSELQIQIDESDINLMSVDEIRELMVKDLEANGFASAELKAEFKEKWGAR